MQALGKWDCLQEYASFILI
uniref:Uncharacterized protein n=1 Tax=Rhizophora mucronata TaxID=61149 RepID=A0A2P2PSP9_RHIMU